MHGVAFSARARLQKKVPCLNSGSSHEQGQRQSHKTRYHLQRFELCAGLRSWKCVNSGHWICFEERAWPLVAHPMPRFPVQTFGFGPLLLPVGVWIASAAYRHTQTACLFVYQPAHRISKFDVFFLNGTVGHAAQLQRMAREMQSMMVLWPNYVWAVCSNTNVLMSQLCVSPWPHLFFFTQWRWSTVCQTHFCAAFFQGQKRVTYQSKVFQCIP